VRTFRQTLRAQLPHLSDVIEPDEDSSAQTRYLLLTLPFHWVEHLPHVVELAGAHGLSGWDPQTEEPIGRQQTRTARPSRPPGDGSAGWTAEHSIGQGLGARSIARAWTLAGLPQQASFGEAVGAFILAMAMRDGVSVNGEEARRAVATVAADCAHGVPLHDVSVRIGYIHTDVTGFARSIEQGRG